MAYISGWIDSFNTERAVGVVAPGAVAYWIGYCNNLHSGKCRMVREGIFRYINAVCAALPEVNDMICAYCVLQLWVRGQEIAIRVKKEKVQTVDFSLLSGLCRSVISAGHHNLRQHFNCFCRNGYAASRFRHRCIFILRCACRKQYNRCGNAAE